MTFDTPGAKRISQWGKVCRAAGEMLADVEWASPHSFILNGDGCKAPNCFHIVGGAQLRRGPQ
jgi:hypothetical protein